MAQIVTITNPLTGQPAKVDQLDHTAQQIDDAIDRAKAGGEIDTLLAGKAPKSEFDEVKAKVMDTNTNTVDVYLTGDDLPSYINSLPRLVNDTIMIYVSGTITQNLRFQGFYGNGGIWIRRNGSNNVKANNITVSFSDCSCRVEFNNFDFTDSGASSNTDYKAVVTILNCRAIWIENCTFTGNGSNKAIFSANHSLVQVSSCTITNFDIALAPWGFSIMSVNDGVSGSNNSRGFYMYGPAIAVLYSNVNKLIGGASNYKDGGVIIQGNAFV